MKTKTQYVCQSCGFSSAKWLGKCSGCGEWNTLVEEVSSQAKTDESSLAHLREEFRGAKSVEYWGEEVSSSTHWQPLIPEGSKNETSEDLEGDLHRLSTGIGELDRVLGGGLVPDSFTLLGGDPGIGKSTILLQMARGLSSKKVLYVSGEESVGQIRRRAARLGIKDIQHIFLAAETQLEKVFATVKELQPDVVLLDSLQTFASVHLNSAPGSVSQVREVAARLMTLAKTAQIAVWLVGHVTKDGNIAGPKTVEHMVDTVLYFEGEGGQSYRLLRAVKNRFGSAMELGVFEMASEGLMEVKNPSSLFLSDRKEAVSGTAIATSLEGSRPILVELQALVAQSPLNLPRRTAVGMDSARLSLLAAILEKHMGLVLADQDLFFNVAGGMKLSEPACDLAAAAAVWSSLNEKPLPADWVFVGEVGLTGEVRRVSQPEMRAEEAKKLGFSTIVLPASSFERCQKIKGIEIRPIAKVSELPNLL